MADAEEEVIWRGHLVDVQAVEEGVWKWHTSEGVMLVINIEHLSWKIVLDPKQELVLIHRTDGAYQSYRFAYPDEIKAKKPPKKPECDHPEVKPWDQFGPRKEEEE